LGLPTLIGMEWTKNPELVAAAEGIARSVPHRIVAVAFLDGEPVSEIVDLGDDEPTLPGDDLYAGPAPEPSRRPASS
jgi:hypothetical protein